MPNPETYSILAGKTSRLWVLGGLTCGDEGGWESWLVDGEEDEAEGSEVSAEEPEAVPVEPLAA